MYYPEYEEPTQFRRISQCFIRKEHSCGKYLGASSTCFIACPSTDEVKMLIELINAKLTQNRIDPVVAVDIRAPGQDIFCTKICGRIIEAQFCITILDDKSIDVKGKELFIPNPNVYYEYGLMTALGKYVIPLQKDGQTLAFNIKTHDTIKYTGSNVAKEIEDAIKEAIKVTVTERESTLGVTIPEHMYRSFLAMKGYQRQGYSWLLSDDIEGTVFTGYKNDKSLEYLFFAVIDSKDLLKTCLMDIQVIQRRINTNCENFSNNIMAMDTRIAGFQKLIEEEKEKKEATLVDVRRISRYEVTGLLSDTIKKQKEEKSKLESIKNSKFGVILNPDLAHLKDKCVTELSTMDVGQIKLPVYFGDLLGIKLGDIDIKFKGPDL
jgi:hypothetical protein